MVVVARAGEAEVRCGVQFVELSNGADACQRVERKAIWEEPRFSPHPRLEVPYEIPLIERIARPLEGPHACLEVEHRRDGAHRAQLARRLRAEITGELEREIASKRVAGHHHPIEAVVSYQFVD